MLYPVYIFPSHIDTGLVQIIGAAAVKFLLTMMVTGFAITYTLVNIIPVQNGKFIIYFLNYPRQELYTGRSQAEVGGGVIIQRRIAAVVFPVLVSPTKVTPIAAPIGITPATTPVPVPVPAIVVPVPVLGAVIVRHTFCPDD